MKHDITPTHLHTVEVFKQALKESDCELPVTYYAGIEPLITDEDKAAISVIHFYDSHDGSDGATEFTLLEDIRQLISEDNDFIRVNVLSLPHENRMDIDLQVTQIS